MAHDVAHRPSQFAVCVPMPARTVVGRVRARGAGRAGVRVSVVNHGCAWNVAAGLSNLPPTPCSHVPGPTVVSSRPTSQGLGPRDPMAATGKIPFSSSRPGRLGQVVCVWPRRRAWARGNRPSSRRRATCVGAHRSLVHTSASAISRPQPRCRAASASTSPSLRC